MRNSIAFPLFICCLFFNSASFSENSDLVQSASCKQYSVDLLKRLKQDVFPDMTSDELKATLSISNETCLTHFAEVEEKIVKKVESEKKQETEDVGNDWFSKYVLEGDPHSKKGVQRLKKKR